MTRTFGQVAAASVAAVVAVMMTGSGVGVQAQPPPKGITLTEIGVYESGIYNNGGSEIAAYDPGSQRVFTVNLENRRIDILDIRNPAAPMKVWDIDVTPWGNQANSVAVHGGIVAIAIEANKKTDPGTVAFFTPYGAVLSAVTVGALPDMLTFTPNGELVLVANEGEPNKYAIDPLLPNDLPVDPEGSVSIIDMTVGVEQLTAANVTTAGFGAFPKASLDPSIRIFGPGIAPATSATVSQDLEPEYIAVSHDSKTAWVTLQENNAIGILDLTTKQFTQLVGLGFKDHNVAGNGLDSSDRDGHTNNITTRQVFGMYQPDGIDTIHHDGRTYLVTANEGDVREWFGIPSGNEAVRLSSRTLDALIFPNGATLKNNAVAGRLNVTRYNGDANGDQIYEALYSFGARSFSVWDADANQIFDSGDAFEQITAERYKPSPTWPASGSPGFFNSTHTNNTNSNPDRNEWTHDNRSDDKGPEPENVTIKRLFGRDFAFIVLERIGGVMVYELTDPTSPRFVDYVNTRVFGVSPNLPIDLDDVKDLGPEGLIVISESESPTGRPLLVVANEVSGTTRIFEIGLKK